MNTTTFAEIKSAIYNTDYWLYLAISDIRRKYARTSVGYFWSIFNPILFITIVGACYSMIFNTPVSVLVPHLSISYFTWQFVTSCINESAPLIHSHGIILKTSRITAPMLMLRTIARNLIIFLQNVILSVLIIAYFQGLPVYVELSIVGIFLILLAITPLCFIIALFTSRYHDIEQIIQSVLLIVFFVTPILWLPSMLKPEQMWLVNWNPVFYFLELVRGPMLGTWPPLISYIVAVGMSASLTLAAFVLYSRVRPRLAHWI